MGWCNMKKSEAWYALFPLDVYALGPFRFTKEKSEHEFREYLREWEGVKRLPKGVEVWPTR